MRRIGKPLATPQSPLAASTRPNTAIHHFISLLSLYLRVGLEIWENHEAKDALIFETSDLPDILPDQLKPGKEGFRSNHPDESDKAA